MSVGSALHAARLEAGLSVDDVAARTRIRGTLIRAIEADNFGPCGGSTYAKGHIRSIAAVVGVDPTPLIAEFNQSQDAAPALPAHQILDRPEIVQRTPSGPNWTAAMLVTAVLLAGVAFVSLMTNPEGTSPPPSADAATSAPVVAAEQPDDTGEPVDPAPSDPVPNDAGPSEPATTAQPQPTQPATAASSSPAAPKPAAPAASSSPPPVVAFNGVTVKISVTKARCWVRVTDASNGRKLVYQGVLERGTVRDFTAASKLSVQFGNAGAVTLKVNGRDIGSPGGPGQVVTLPFVPGDPGAG